MVLVRMTIFVAVDICGGFNNTIFPTLTPLSSNPRDCCCSGQRTSWPAVTTGKSAAGNSNNNSDNNEEHQTQHNTTTTTTTSWGGGTGTKAGTTKACGRACKKKHWRNCFSRHNETQRRELAHVGRHGKFSWPLGAYSIDLGWHA